MRWKLCLPCNICILNCIMWTHLKPLCDARAFGSASEGAQSSLQEICVCVCVCVCARVLSRVQLFATPCTIAAMGFPRQEYWSELLFPTPYICTYCDNTYHCIWCNNMCSLLLLPLSCSSCVQLCETPQTAAHQALPSLGFSRQEHWSGLLFPSPMHESAK